jgi:hypothetical protein
MNMSMMTIEVDGGFRNPYVLVAMCLWLALLLAFLLPAANYFGRRWRFRAGVLGAIVMSIVFVIPTHVARALIGTMLYQIQSRTIVSVGFWGGSAPFLVPLVAAVCWLAVFVRANRATPRSAA